MVRLSLDVESAKIGFLTELRSLTRVARASLRGPTVRRYDLRVADSRRELESLSLLSQKEAVVERMYRTHAFLWPRE